MNITATGKRGKDFDAANALLKFDETPEGYVWHHLDNYNAENNTLTLELVRQDAHNATKPHAGSCSKYDAVKGKSYN